MGRFVSRDGSEMAHKLREMMRETTDDGLKAEIRRLAEKMESMQSEALKRSNCKGFSDFRSLKNDRVFFDLSDFFWLKDI